MLAFAIYMCAFSTDQPLTSQPLQSIPAYCKSGSSWIKYKWNGYDDGYRYIARHRDWLCASVCENDQCQYKVVDMFVDTHNDVLDSYHLDVLEMFLDDHPNNNTHVADLCPECCYSECGVLDMSDQLLSSGK
jgi:hypothetical protein